MQQTKNNETRSKPTWEQHWFNQEDIEHKNTYALFYQSG